MVAPLYQDQEGAPQFRSSQRAESLVGVSVTWVKGSLALDTQNKTVHSIKSASGETRPARGHCLGMSRVLSVFEQRAVDEDVNERAREESAPHGAQDVCRLRRWTYVG